MATPAQIAANRRNAQRSTGPRTPEGKAISSQNSRTHGIFSKGFRFQNLVSVRLAALQLRSLKEDYPPETPEEEAILVELAFRYCLGRELEKFDLRVFDETTYGPRRALHGPNLAALSKIANAIHKNGDAIGDLIFRHKALIKNRTKPEERTQMEPKTALD